MTAVMTPSALAHPVLSAPHAQVGRTPCSALLHVRMTYRGSRAFRHSSLTGTQLVADRPTKTRANSAAAATALSMGELLLVRAAIASVFVYATLQWTFLKYFRKKADEVVQVQESEDVARKERLKRFEPAAPAPLDEGQR